MRPYRNYRAVILFVFCDYIVCATCVGYGAIIRTACGWRSSLEGPEERGGVGSLFLRTILYSEVVLG